MDNINIPISPGELLDKITILEIKAEHIQSEEKLLSIKTELKLLNMTWEKSSLNSNDIQILKQQLKVNNKNLWDTENQIRIKESNKEFDQEFIELARSVYIQNDKRTATKRKINEQLGSKIVEEKSYAEY